MSYCITGYLCKNDYVSELCITNNIRIITMKAHPSIVSHASHITHIDSHRWGRYSLFLHVAVLRLVNPRRACTARVTVVGSVCVLPLQLTPRRSVRSTNDTTYSADNENQFNRRIFSEKAPLRRSASTASVLWKDMPAAPRVSTLVPFISETSLGERVCLDEHLV